MQKLVSATLVSAALTGALACTSTLATEGIETPIPTPQLAADGTVIAAAASYIVVLKAPAVAAHEGSADYAAPDRVDGRLDVNGSATVAYAQFLQGTQDLFVEQAGEALGRQVQTSAKMQHAINAVVMTLTPQEAATIAEMPEVRFVEPPRNYETDTDVGPTLINAPGIWDGSNTDGAMGTRGEGMVVGIIDSGINHDHPSFAAVSEPGTGNEYTHDNPLGSGNFLGFCADNPASADFVCNDKLIGAYEFTFDVVSADPDANEDAFPDDTNGHGTHVASTAIGNTTIANYLGVDPEVSGVAPRANVIAYDVCYTQISTGRGLCPNASTLAGINQVVADGIVDVVNYSISGGANPWDEANSLAFLNAIDAGIFVSASAGNSGPGPNSLGHLEPWVTSVAAASHGRFFADAELVAGTQPNAGAIEGTGPALGAALTDDIRFFDTNAEGCDAGGGIPAATFDDGGDGTIALISRGSCGFLEKVTNATNAGARAVVVFTNRAGTPFSMGLLETTTIPAVMISQSAGESLRDEIIANGMAATSATITPVDPAVTSVDVNSADIVASFSSRGPNPQNIVKPDVAGPGVSILAAFSDGNGATSPGPEFEILQGTSMSSPHNAGAAALLRDLHPSWSPAEIKSALMLTANSNMQDDNGDGTVGTATPFDMGAGRVDLTDTVGIPVVMNELTTRFLQADPGNGGDPRTLNLASMSDDACPATCSWNRTVRSVNDTAVDFTAAFGGDGEMIGTVTPATFTLLPGQSQTLTIEADTSGITVRDEWKFGQVSLTAAGEPTLQMPVTVFPLGPQGAVTPDSVSAQLDPETTATADIVISSTGGSDLTYTVNPNPTGSTRVLNQPQASNSGILSRINTSVPNAIAAADDVTLGGITTLTSVSAAGFQNGSDLVDTSTEVSLYIWADDAGEPAGSPFDADTNAVAEITLAVPDPGLNLTGDTITFDLAALGQTVTLDPGTYWISVVPTSTASWGWFYGPDATGTGDAALIGADFGVPNWTSLINLGIPQQSLNLLVNAEVSCGAPWISEDPSNGVVATGDTETVTVTIDSAGFTRGSFGAFECVETDDLSRPNAVVPVTMIVNNTPPAVTGESLAVGEAGTTMETDGSETSLLANDTDFDSDPLTLSMMAATAPANGEVTLNGDGTFSYTHDGSETTSDTFDYEVCDNAPTPGCTNGTVAVTITAVNDPPTAMADAMTVAENGSATTLDGGATSLLDNDMDPEADPLTATATPTVAPVNGTVTINSDGTFEYLHNGSETDSDSFEYEVCDDSNACSTANVTVQIAGVNTAPDAVADDVRVVVGGTIAMTSDGQTSVLANDTDPEGNMLTVTETPTVAPMLGTLVLATDGSFTYTHTGMEAGVDTFSYQVCDDGQPQECSSADVTINILADLIFADGLEEPAAP